MKDNYKEARDKFMHSSGSSAEETFFAIFPTFSYALLSVILTSLFSIKNRTLQFIFEFLCIVIPTILHMTLLSEITLQLCIYPILFVITLMYIIFNFKSVQRTVSQSSGKSISYITNLRSMVNFMSVVAILAVDFRIFPRKFAKTENFGYSLMDVGVGLFVFANGIVDTGKKTNLLKLVKGSLPLLVLGVGRLIVTKYVDYHVPVTEYGLHWNFFVTLLVCKLFVSLLFSIVNIRFIWINATLLLISHEILLHLGLTKYVISDMERTTFLTANREGIVSSIGYVCLYIYSAYFGYFLNLKNDPSRKVRSITRFMVVSVLTLALSVIFQRNFGISRKLVNAAYCFWILFIGFFIMMLFYVFERIRAVFLNDKLSYWIQTPLIFEGINYNGLVFFLFSNALTGVVNMTCDTLIMNSGISLLIISIYMLINCGLVCVLYKKQIQLKL